MSNILSGHENLPKGVSTNSAVPISEQTMPTIFIPDFAGKCIREKVMLEIPIPPQTNNRDEYTRLYKEYTSLKYHYAKHVASRRTFHYPVKQEQDGKELREGVDFEIKTRSAKYKCPRCRHTFKDKQDHGCMDGYKLIYEIEWEDILPVAVPIEPDTPLRTKDELVKNGEAGYEWLNYIKQFPKLDELWNQLPNVPNVWLSQQIDIFAGKYPSKSDTYLQPVKDEGSFADYIRNARNSFVTKYLSMYPEPKQRILAEDLLTAYDKMRERLSEPSSKEQEGNAVGYGEWIAEKIDQRKLGWIKDWKLWRNWEEQGETGIPVYNTPKQILNKWQELKNKQL